MAAQPPPSPSLLKLNTASEPHLLSNTSTGKAVTEDVKSFPPTRRGSFSIIRLPAPCDRVRLKQPGGDHERNGLRARASRNEKTCGGAAARRRHSEFRAGRFRYRARAAARPRCRAARALGEQRLLSNLPRHGGGDREPPDLRARQRSVGCCRLAHVARRHRSRKYGLQ